MRLVFLMQRYSEEAHINVGTGEDITITIRELAQRIASYNGKIVYDRSKPDGTPRKVMDVTRSPRSAGERNLRCTRRALPCTRTTAPCSGNEASSAAACPRGTACRTRENVGDDLARIVANRVDHGRQFLLGDMERVGPGGELDARLGVDFRAEPFRSPACDLSAHPQPPRLHSLQCAAYWRRIAV
jgi:hypothetical protein